MRVAWLVTILTLGACDPALELPDRPTEKFVASGAKWLRREAQDRRCGCVGRLPARPTLRD